MNIIYRASLVVVCFLCQMIGGAEATRYPAALGVIIVSVLLPGFVIFAFVFTAIFLCCYWRKIPFLRRQFDKSSQGRAKPKKIPAAAYPHQSPPPAYSPQEKDAAYSPKAMDAPYPPQGPDAAYPPQGTDAAYPPYPVHYTPAKQGGDEPDDSGAIGEEAEARILMETAKTEEDQPIQPEQEKLVLPDKQLEPAAL